MVPSWGTGSLFWVTDGNFSCGKFLEQGKLIPLETLRDRYGCFSMDWWRHKHLQHFIVTHGSSKRGLYTLTPFDHLVIEEEPTLHLISKLYQLLGSVSAVTKPAFIREREHDLEIEFSAGCTCLDSPTPAS